MKKTIIALLALSGIAMGADSDSITVTEAFTINTVIDGATTFTLTTPANYSTVELGTLTDGTTASLVTTKDSKVGTWGQTNAWSNAAAIEDMNLTLGTSFTVAQIATLSSSGNWGGSTKTNIVLDLGEAAYAGESITLYAFVSNALGNGSSQMFSISGLDDGYTVEQAGNAGNGFDGSVSTDQDLTLYKVTGVLTDEDIVLSTVTANSTLAKNGWSMVAYSYSVPEPTTATLSLLALAGLAARRRRK